jgi:tRNA (Thr-GGU) A37 N-methylase
MSRVEALDAADGSPIVDIKPYIQPYDTEDPTVPEWMIQIHKDLGINLLETDTDFHLKED